MFTLGPVLRYLEHLSLAKGGLAGITTQPFGQTIRFRFTNEPIPRNISTIQAGTFSDLVKAKTAHIKYLQEEIRYKKVEGGKLQTLGIRRLGTETR